MVISPEIFQQFKKALQALNEAQRQAVETIEGPVMVMAGPGTGKTQVLAMRIANILLKTDTNPSSILALTFTDSAAKNMRERLVKLIGKTGYYVQIETFHSFCSQVIQQFPEFFPLERDSQALSDLERFEIMQQVIDRLSLAVLKPLNSQYFYVKDLVKTISDLKREGVSVERFAEIVAEVEQAWEQRKAELTKRQQITEEKKVRKQQELVSVYEAYQQELRARKRYDFDDMIALVSEQFATNEELLITYQEKLLYFLVDEYQDTNSAQNQVVDLLASFWGEQANVFVVGDPNQAIYRFQGASLENVVGFAERYPQALLVTLNQGYRCPQAVYDLAKLVVPALPDHFGEPAKQMISQNAAPGTVGLYVAPSNTLEAVYVVERIAALIAAGADPSRIAILYRHNSDAGDFGEVLGRWGISYEVEGGTNVLAVPELQQWLQFCQLITKLPTNHEFQLLFAVLLQPWWQLPTVKVMQLARQAAQQQQSLWDLLLVSSEPELRTIATRITDWLRMSLDMPLVAWLETVMHESGFLPWVLTHPQRVQLVRTVQAFLREVKALSVGKPSLGLAELLSILDTYQEHGLSIIGEDLNVTKSAVKLSTVHKAKGQEWQHVFVVRCIDGKWGNTRSRELLPLPEGILQHTELSSIERDDDDRRLLYVAMTRAQSSLTLSYPETMLVANRSKAIVPSVLIEELRSSLPLDQGEVAQRIITDTEAVMEKLLEVPVPRQLKSDEQLFFAELVKDLKLSVSMLNTYLQSPAQFVQRHLLKVPEPPAVPLAFGVAVHSALEYWYRQVMAGQPPELVAILKVFEERLQREALTAEEMVRRLTYGRDVLAQYYQAKVTEPVQPLFIERFFGSGWSRTMLGDITLVGKIDRVDWIDLPSKTVRLIDYKTGRPKTVGEIEATVASADLSERELTLPASIRGAYKRQLIFYQLLTQLDRSFEPQVAQTSLEFIEPDPQSGKFITRDFTIQPEEVTDLQQLITEVMAEIRGLAFLNEDYFQLGTA